MNQFRILGKQLDDIQQNPSKGHTFDLVIILLIIYPKEIIKDMCQDILESLGSHCSL